MHVIHISPLSTSGITLWLLILGVFAWLATGSMVEGATVTLAWDAPTTNVDGSPLTDLGGYKVYYGTTSGVYATVLAVGSVTTATVTNLQPGMTYFFAVTCYDIYGNESAFSQELTVVATDPPYPNSALKMNCLCQPTGKGETGFVVGWVSVTGVYYTVERSTNLRAVPAFTAIASHVPGQGSSSLYTDPTATGSGPYYYRVQAEPPGTVGQ